MSTSPTQRSLAWARKQGASAQSVEKWIAVEKHPAGGVRRDLFGWIDLIVAWPGEGLIGVQACAGASASARIAKAKALEGRDRQGLLDWLGCEATLEVWAWRKVGPRGKRKLWDVRRVPVVLADLLPDAPREMDSAQGPGFV